MHKQINKNSNLKKTSKTASKKVSKKASKKVSKKASKKVSKKPSKTVSKKASKTVSKTVSKTISDSFSSNTINTNSKIKNKIPSKKISKNILKNKNINSLKQIKKNIQTVKKKLEDKNMTNIFWVISDRADFKPLTKIVTKDEEEIKTIIHSIKELRDHLLDEKGEYYKGKKLASIKIIFFDDIVNKLEKLGFNGLLNNSILTHKDYFFIKEKPILSILITIYPIDVNGSINPNNENSWGLKVNYYVDDFTGIKFKLKNVEVLMRLVCDSVVKTDLNEGMTYKNLAIQLNKNKNNKK